MKKFIILSFIALISAFVTFQSCTKNEVTAWDSSAQFFDGDEYDKGLVVEEPEEIEEKIDDTDYQSEEGAKIVNIAGNTLSDFFNEDNNCEKQKYRYKEYLSVGIGDFWSQIAVELSTSNKIISVTTNKPNLIKVDTIFQSDTSSNIFNINFKGLNDSSFKTKSVKFTFMLNNGKSLSKSLKCGCVLGYPSSVGFGYGLSEFPLYYELRKMGKVYNPSGTRITIPSDYYPQIGDCLYFGSNNNNTDQKGIITTVPIFKAATATKPAHYKFKIVQMNASCNNRKTTKSITMTDPTQIKSADGTTLATKYFRD